MSYMYGARLQSYRVNKHFSVYIYLYHLLYSCIYSSTNGSVALTLFASSTK